MIITFVLTFIILTTLLYACVPSVLATPEHRIVLPFWTSWENQQPLGRVNSVDHMKDFYGYFGPSDPLPPELGTRNNEVSPPSDVFGYEFGSRQLMAAGYFGSSDSHCYFNLFDQTEDSDYDPPIKIRPYTFINIWYYHHTQAHCMIDAQLYNKRTHEYKSLSTFVHTIRYDSITIYKYVEDQNKVRIHPGHRYNDPVNSWQFASFDLSVVYENDPDNWYITEIWVGFDNTIDPSHPTGQVRTYFDMLYISYGTGNRQYTAHYDETQFYESTLTASITTWYYSDRPDGLYDLNLKLGISAYTEGYVKDFETGDPKFFIRPYRLKVSTTHSGSQYRLSPEPTGLNLTQPDPELDSVTEFVLETLFVIVKQGTGLGLAFSIVDLAASFIGLLHAPDPDAVTYEWPHAIGWWTEDIAYYVLPYLIQGEVYLQIQGLSPGSHTIPIAFEVENCYADYYPDWGITPILWSIESFTLNIDWTTTADNIYALTIQADTGGTTDPLPGIYYYNDPGTIVSVTANPSSDYQFDYWYLDGSWYSDSRTTTVTMNADHTLKAWFSPKGCVAEGTLVTMADGSTKPIEKIKKGDQVLGFDPATGSYMAENVLDTIKHQVEVIVNINYGRLRLTPFEQPIYIRNSTYEGWIRDPANIQVGWEIYEAQTNGWVPVSSVTYEEGKTRVYDMVLDGYTTYIANGILVMDKNGC